MRISFRSIVGLLGLGLCGAALGAAAVVGLPPGADRLESIGQLNARCRQRIDDDGFGHAVIGSVHLSDQTGNLTVACKIRLKPGSTLQLNKVHMQTKNVLIEDSGDTQKPTHLVINQSTLMSPTGGFQIKLAAPRSTVAVNNDLFSYYLSIGVSVGATDKDAAASLDVTDSIFRSKSSQTEGVVLVSTGQIMVARSRFQSASAENPAMLLGTRCKLVDNNGVNQRCRGG